MCLAGIRKYELGRFAVGGRHESSMLRVLALDHMGMGQNTTTRGRRRF